MRAIGFTDVLGRLLETLRERIANGEITERGMARLTGISQPHVHNVLKGVRSLSPEACDFIMAAHNLSVVDLFSEEELRQCLSERSLAHEPQTYMNARRGLLGPGHRWPRDPDPAQKVPVPCSVLGERRQLALVRLGFDRAMETSAGPWDLAAIDMEAVRFSHLSLSTLYVVDRGHDAVVRYLRPGWGCVYLVCDGAESLPAIWEPVRISDSGRLPILGTVCWLGRSLEKKKPGRQAESLPRRAASA